MATAAATGLGSRARDFALQGIDGRRWRLADAKGPKGTLVMFICNHCPYVKSAIDRIVADVRELQTQGIGAIAIMSNDTEAYPADSFANMKVFADRHGFTFPYVIDETQEVARSYDAVCTPEFFGYDSGGTLRYHGRLDEGKTSAPPAGARRELLQAMRAVAQGKDAPVEQIPSMGCSIKWRREE
jgi:peroxiredoxin